MLYQSASVCNFDIPLLSAHLMSQSILSVSGLYRPMILEFPEWPTINYDSKPPSCPFDIPYKVKIAKQAKVKVKSKKRTGYCECCKVKFTNLNNHLKSKENTEFANNPENYKELDEIIKKKPFEKYKEELKAKYYKT